MRDGGTLTADEVIFKKKLDYALDKLPDYSGTVYRSISSEYIDDLITFNSAHQVGNFIMYDAYTSTSQNVYDEDMDIQFIIQTKHGKDISRWNSNEQEVLHRRGTKFFITGIDGNTIYRGSVMDNKKIPNRFCDSPKARIIPCSNCKYRLGVKPACEAYQEQIPTEVLSQVLAHPDKECAEGYRYTPKDEAVER